MAVTSGSRNRAGGESGPAAPSRSARAASFSLVGVLLAAAAHAASGGMLPGVRPLLACIVVLALLAYAAAGREWTLASVVTAVLVVQVALHLALHRLGAPAGMTGTGADSIGAGLHALRRWCGPTLGPASARGAGSLAATMLAAHLAAALLVAWWLRRGEAALWSAARRASGGADLLLARLLRRLTSPLATPVRGPARRLDRTAAAAVGRHVELVSSLVRRGPPAAVTG